MTIVVDFDGTLAELDVGDEVCGHFTSANMSALEERYRSGELSLPETQRHMWAGVKASGEEMARFAREVGALRAGAELLLERDDIVIASGGFGLYIEAILGSRMDALAGSYFSDLLPSVAGCGVRFPHDDLTCERCAICKAKVVERHDARAFIGDGFSDLCVIETSVQVFAVEGSPLAAHCARAARPHTTFTDLSEVVSQL